MNSSALHARQLRRVLLRAPFEIYRWALSPLLHAVSGSSRACRFQPSCSEYAAIAFERHGFLRGTLLAFKRLARCHPFHAPAFDPVPLSSRHGVSRGPMQTSERQSTIEETGSGQISLQATRRRAINPFSRRVRDGYQKLAQPVR